MSIAHLLTRPAVVTTRTPADPEDLDDRGAPKPPSEGTYDTLVHFAQVDATEITIGQETYTVTGQVFLAAGSPLTAADRIRITDLDADFEVIGTPKRPWRPRGGEHHVEAMVREVTT